MRDAIRKLSSDKALGGLKRGCHPRFSLDPCHPPCATTTTPRAPTSPNRVTANNVGLSSINKQMPSQKGGGHEVRGECAPALTPRHKAQIHHLKALPRARLSSFLLICLASSRPRLKLPPGRVFLLAAKSEPFVCTRPACTSNLKCKPPGRFNGTRASSCRRRVSAATYMASQSNAFAACLHGCALCNCV